MKEASMVIRRTFPQPDLGPVLKKAVAIVKAGEPVLVDVVSQGR
jgi:hypothetical protein